MNTRKIYGFILWEKWKIIPTFENEYKCSTLGNVKSIKKYGNRLERVYKKSIGWGGYRISLNKDGIYGTYTIHLLVALTFLNYSSFYQKSYIKHKDGNKLKNYLSNLEIVF